MRCRVRLCCIADRTQSKSYLKCNRWSKIVCDRAVKAAALAELRRADADAATVAQLVNFVEEIHDIETDLKTARDVRNLEVSLKRQIRGSVIGHAFGIGETAPKSASVKPIAGQFPIVPGVSCADGGGPSLVVIEEDATLVDEGILIRIKQKLGGADVDAAGPRVSDVSVSGKR